MKKLMSLFLVVTMVVCLSAISIFAAEPTAPIAPRAMCQNCHLGEYSVDDSGVVVTVTLVTCTHRPGGFTHELHHVHGAYFIKCNNCGYSYLSPVNYTNVVCPFA